MNHYETLGVAQTATPEELKAAFRRLAKQHHPDMGGDQAVFQQINEAYSTLSEPDSRAHYDHMLRNPQSQFNPFNQAQQRGGGNPFEFHFNFGGGPDPFSAFHEQFAQQFGFSTRQPPRNRNLRLIVEIDFLETLQPISKVLNYQTTNNKETLQVDIPPGIEHGAVFTISGRGDDANGAIPRGNLEIQISIRPHSRFLRHGENIVEEITIDCFDAILGTTIPLHLPSGKFIELNIPAGTQHQSQFGITDEGYPRSNGTRGKYIAKLNILIPTALTKQQLELLNQIQKLRPINT
jgi:DnaJ-class molecular chaperone